MITAYTAVVSSDLINVDVDVETNSQLTDVQLSQFVTACRVRNLFDENSISTKL